MNEEGLSAAILETAESLSILWYFSPSNSPSLIDQISRSLFFLHENIPLPELHVQPYLGAS